MKRYSWDLLRQEEYEDIEGEWVRYGDVGTLIKANESPECNCAEVSSDMIEGGRDVSVHPSWICPAHGYKRL